MCIFQHADGLDKLVGALFSEYGGTEVKTVNFFGICLQFCFFFLLEVVIVFICPGLQATDSSEELGDGVRDEEVCLEKTVEVSAEVC